MNALLAACIPRSIHMKKLILVLSILGTVLLSGCDTVGGGFYGNNNGAMIGIGSGISL